MASCSKNWENCTMCVQDLIQPHVNITAEISKQEVDNFVRLCQIFSKQSSKYFDDCFTRNTLSTVSKTDVPSEILKHNPDFLSSIEKEILNSRMPTVLETRKRYEVEITSRLATYIQKFDPSLKLYPLGSTQYGVQITNANFNLLVSTSEFNLFACAFRLFNCLFLLFSIQMV